MRQLRLSHHIAATLLLGALTQSFAAQIVFQNLTPEGDYLRLEAKPGSSSEESTSKVVPTVGSTRYTLFRSKTPDRGGDVLWSRSLPPYATNAAKSGGGFRVLDVLKETNRLFLCYKVDKDALVEAASVPESNVTTNESPIPLNRDAPGLGRVCTSAVFTRSNGLLLLRLGFKDCRVRAWVQQESVWLRSTQYDATIPPWARPIDLSDPKLPGGPIREAFPAEDYPDAHWGAPEAGLQLGIRFEHSSYSEGEPIIVKLHVKNSTTSTANYQVSTLSSTRGPVLLSVRDSNNREAESKMRDLAAFVPLLTKALKAGTQNVYGFPLRRQFDLPPGIYTVTARLRVPAQTGETVLTSGAATIDLK